MDLKEWFESQPEGAQTQMMFRSKEVGTPVSWATICRAKRGAPISKAKAKIISKLTGHKVSIPSLTGKTAGLARSSVLVRPRKRRRAAA